MQSEAKVKSFYESGFPKQVQRNKYNLELNVRLKEARNHKGLSARQVVNDLKKRGVSIGHSTLQGYEADENSLNHRYPSLPVLMELANFYDCSLDFLFGITDKIDRKTNKTDLKNVLEGKGIVTYGGKRIKKDLSKRISGELEMIVAKL